MLYVQMLGNFSVTLNDRQINCKDNRSRQLWILLAYLICHRREVSSAEVLSSLLWNEEKGDSSSGALQPFRWSMP